jgi:hypothetical protein
MNTPENTLDPREIRRHKILDCIVRLAREAIAEQLDDVEHAAAEAASDDDENGKPVVAKIALSIKWPAGAQEPEIDVKSSYSIRRTVEASGKADEPTLFDGGAS